MSRIVVNIGPDTQTLSFEEQPTVAEVRSRAGAPEGSVATDPATDEGLSDYDMAPGAIEFTPAKSKQAA